MALMQKDDSELVKLVLAGDSASFEPLVIKYQPRIFAMARRYTNTEEEARDLVQEIFLKAYQKLSSFKSRAPFEHWLMRLAIRTCYDTLRNQKRKKEITFSDLAENEQTWLERFVTTPDSNAYNVQAAQTLVNKILEQLSPNARLVITLLEIEDKSVKEVSKLTGWPETLVKVRAFRARAEMRKILSKINPEKYL